MLAPGAMVFQLDVDDTLLDNDRFVADQGERLEQSFGVYERDLLDFLLGVAPTRAANVRQE